METSVSLESLVLVLWYSQHIFCICVVGSRERESRKPNCDQTRLKPSCVQLTDLISEKLCTIVSKVRLITLRSCLNGAINYTYDVNDNFPGQ